mmetsp:Transcript_49448/g.96975  ORF Transcript_49448/g.96975 Transcript_49448/m.96975 type:complete len:389 (+) Transcript_49448:70-1236(+)|eukprot:CAMPEP_0175165944 /NCGR_PEP_ID=MMETSP0087-20121206/27399_1 /TAXON_ID=136419 /ORGANISM="Unknown Unknown, Strain D1" /LENGTH=388 /DNA_ID=CAMNT_0016455441 /DNA_START=62 /DNA_END=1228 /DNA_ORIENTATION=+
MSSKSLGAAGLVLWVVLTFLFHDQIFTETFRVSNSDGDQSPKLVFEQVEQLENQTTEIKKLRKELEDLKTSYEMQEKLRGTEAKEIHSLQDSECLSHVKMYCELKGKKCEARNGKGGAVSMSCVRKSLVHHHSWIDWDVSDWMRLIAEQKQLTGHKATFLQVGANDGTTNDPLLPALSDNFTAWVGLLVEPSSFNFGLLVERHKDRGDWSFVQAVVTDKCDGNTSVFYEYPQTVAAANYTIDEFVNGEKVPRYIAVGQGNGLSKLNNFLNPTQISCYDNITTLINLHASNAFKAEVAGFLCNTQRLDVLQIDCETNDWRVLAALDLAVLRPRVIHFEGYGSEVGKALHQLGWSNYLLMRVSPRRDDYLAIDPDSFFADSFLPEPCGES